MALEKTRNFHKAAILKCAIFIKNVTEDVTNEQISTYYDRCTEAWRLFQEVHIEILHVTGEEFMPYQEAEFDSVEAVALDIIPRYKTHLRAFTNNDEFVDAHSKEGDDVINKTNGGLRVPYFKIPLFAGNYDAWPAFKDLFRAMIHFNEKMSPVQKLGYLKANVSGEALQIIKNLEITDANYYAAWTLLVDRYDNQRFLINRWIHLIVSIPYSKGSAADIKAILDGTQEALQGLKNLNRPIEQYDDFLIYLTETKLDQKSKQKWEDEIAGIEDNAPQWNQMVAFLKTRFRALEVAVVQSITNQNNNFKQTHSSKATLSESSARINLDECLFCKKKHRLTSCFSFQKKPFNERQSFVNENRLCTNCLLAGHKAISCSSTYACRLCQQRHHTLLHVTTHSSNVTSINMNSQHEHHFATLLATALINVCTSTGVNIQLRALIDQGSQISFIRSNVANQLKLRILSGGPAVKSVGTDAFIKTKGVTQLTFSSHISSTNTFQTTVSILDKITGQLPSEFVNLQLPKDWKRLPLADPMFYKPATIDVLLGADVLFNILQDGLLKMNNDQIIAQKSSLGWLLSGKVKLTNPVPVVVTGSIAEVEESFGSLSKQLQAFWEIENVSSGSVMDLDDQLCEEYFEATHSRDESGRFIVRLPFKPIFGDIIRLGNSRNAAIYNWQAIEKRMEKSPNLRASYNTIMDKFIENKYMQLIPPSELQISSERSCYLVHHIVTRGGKDRIVFNASKKTSSGFSLNDALLIGPPLQNELFDIIVRVRQFRIAFSTDVVKMYRQFAINNLDIDYQRLIYRKSKMDKVQDYRLLTVLDGTACASYLANKVIRTLAKSEQSHYPLACKVAERDIYVDDLLSGSHDIKLAIETRDQLISLFKSAGMELSKWSSNQFKMLQSLPNNSLQSTIELEGADVVKTLGIFWSPRTDEFQYRIRIENIQGTITKRKLLSEASKLFDPIGWLAPCIIVPKMLFQSLWSVSINWDDPLPKDILDKWMEFRQQLHYLEKLKIRRWTGNSPTNKLSELHGFSDASTKAYSAVVYTKVVDGEGKIVITLLTAKTKVAPIKTISLPRLELCGALLLAHLLEKVMKATNFSLSYVHAHTDSRIVLAWLQSRPSRWKTFVANRTAEILRILPSSHWHHIRSENNPADCASRGITPSSLLTYALWWNGPAVLAQSIYSWPHSSQSIEIEINADFEERRNVLVVANIRIQPMWDIRTKYSTLSKLLRVTAYCLRFIQNCRQTATKVKGCIAPVELDIALNYCIKVTQAIYFSNEILSLRKGRQIPKDSNILRLNPLLDSFGILRVGGRLTNSELPLDRMHPIILPKKDHFIDLIMDFYHKRTLHGNIQVMLNSIRDKYWILSARSTVRNWVHRCNRCYRFSAKAAQQLMGDLPASRVLPSRPFSHTAIDYAGPVKIKMRKGRGYQVNLKGYVSIFVCMATRAIHLELVGDLTADAFIAAFKRFTSRRGYISDLYTDNGSNFVAAHDILSEEHRQAMLDQEIQFAELLANDGVTWHFSPPSAPHFNGLAEAGVRSMKYHFRRIIGLTLLTYEELNTVLCQIEAVLNSRPISPLTDDFSDFSVLTPGHFLIGSAPLTTPQPSLLSVNENRLSRWQLTEQMKQSFWKIWSLEYLNNLQQRPKWRVSVQNLSVGQLVIIQQDNLPPMKWLLGRIQEIHPGPDELVRVASVRTQNSILTRPIAKLCPLPLQQLPSLGDASEEN